MQPQFKKRMKKVLFLNSRSPFPIRDGASIGTNQYLRFFHDLGYDVDLCYVSEKDDLDVVSKGVGQYCNQVRCFPIPKWQSYLKSLHGFMTSPYPLQVCYYYSRKLSRWVKEHAADYDIIYCHNMRTARYAEGLGQYKIWNIVDAFSMNYESAITHSHGLWKWIYKTDARRCSRYEQKLLGEFNKKLIVSQKDRDFIVDCAGGKADITVVENYTVIPEGPGHETPVLKTPNLVFVGAMNYEPNITAVTYFCNHILPVLLKTYPNLHFYIVGKTPAASVCALQSEHVTVTGFVDDVWDYFRKASVVIAPMQSGSGLQNKILQALAVGACVVTTPIGFEGLVHAEGQPFIAETDEEMVKQISFLLDSPEARSEEGKKSVGYIKKFYSIDVIRAKFKAFMDA